jgi:hypothetical protein
MMNRQKTTRLTLFFFVTYSAVYGQIQVIHSPVSRSDIQFGAYSKRFTDPLSFTNNQAALASPGKAGVGVYSEERFLLRDLRTSGIAVSLPGYHGGLGLQMIYFGSGDYDEAQFGFAYARLLGAAVSLGVQFNYYSVHISGYGNTGTVSAAIGVLFHPSDKVHIGFQVNNPAGARFRNSREKLATVIRAGIGYEISGQLLSGMEIIKEENKPVNVQAGFHYAFAKKVFLKVGVSSSAAAPFCGAGLFWDDFRLDIHVSYQYQPGLTPGFQLVYYFKNEREKQQAL